MLAVSSPMAGSLGAVPTDAEGEESAEAVISRVSDFKQGSEEMARVCRGSYRLRGIEGGSRVFL